MAARTLFLAKVARHNILAVVYDTLHFVTCDTLLFVTYDTPLSRSFPPDPCRAVCPRSTDTDRPLLPSAPLSPGPRSSLYRFPAPHVRFDHRAPLGQPIRRAPRHGQPPVRKGVRRMGRLGPRGIHVRQPGAGQEPQAGWPSPVS